jgi:hypothetical protein
MIVGKQAEADLSLKQELSLTDSSTHALLGSTKAEMLKGKGFNMREVLPLVHVSCTF